MIVGWRQPFEQGFSMCPAFGGASKPGKISRMGATMDDSSTVGSFVVLYDWIRFIYITRGMLTSFER